MFQQLLLEIQVHLIIENYSSMIMLVQHQSKNSSYHQDDNDMDHYIFINLFINYRAKNRSLKDVKLSM